VGLYRYAGKPLGFYTKLIVGSVNRKEIQKNGRRLLAGSSAVGSLEQMSAFPKFVAIQKSGLDVCKGSQDASRILQSCRYNYG
jgi:hypothetical protein